MNYCNELNILPVEKNEIAAKFLTRLERLHVKEIDRFPAGLFPSYRQYQKNRTRIRDDDNNFFTAVIIFTLHNIKPKLSIENRIICDRIISYAKPVFSTFKNKHGLNTYNFWQTKPPVVFPNSGWINLMNESHRLPDDMDDTVMTLMALEAHRDTVIEVHDLMQNFTNNTKKRVKNTKARYKFIQAYSTWFGIKMPIDFDVCVLANVLYMVSFYKLDWTEADFASLKYIEEVINSDDYITCPDFVSPHYESTSVILYHLARLMGVNNTLLISYREKLINTATELFNNTQNIVEKAMLGSTLRQWHSMPNMEITSTFNESFFKSIENNDFVFFKANMTSMLPNPFKEWLGKTGIGKFNYYCPAYNLVLYLESIL